MVAGVLRYLGRKGSSGRHILLCRLLFRRIHLHNLLEFEGPLKPLASRDLFQITEQREAELEPNLPNTGLLAPRLGKQLWRLLAVVQRSGGEMDVAGEQSPGWCRLETQHLRGWVSPLLCRLVLAGARGPRWAGLCRGTWGAL